MSEACPSIDIQAVYHTPPDVRHKHHTNGGAGYPRYLHVRNLLNLYTDRVVLYSVSAEVRVSIQVILL